MEQPRTMNPIDPIRYDLWLEEALRTVVKRALDHTLEHGLQGDHHYYVTFDTNADGVDIPDHLHALHPDDMTIVIQHQFDDLSVDDDMLAVTLRFSGRPTRLFVPLTAITAFADPSVNFGLQLRMTTDEDDLDDDDDDPDDMEMTAAMDDLTRSTENENTDGTIDEAGTAEVVSLDAFRKK